MTNHRDTIERFVVKEMHPIRFGDITSLRLLIARIQRESEEFLTVGKPSLRSMHDPDTFSG